jgi:hypothetical protein
VELSSPVGIQNLFVTVVSQLIIAHSIAAAWMARLLILGWQRPRDWVDGMGQLLGLLWIASLIFMMSPWFL